MKKAVFLTILAVFACMGLFAQTESDFQVALTADNTGAVITGYTDKGISELRIPETIQGFPVKEIGTRAFYNNSTITSVTLPSSIVKIGDEAFNSCSKLWNVIFPPSVRQVEFVTRVVKEYNRYLMKDQEYNTTNFGGCNLSLWSWAELKRRGYPHNVGTKKIGNYVVTLTNDYTGLRIVKAEFDLVYALTSQGKQFYERATIPNVVISASIEGMTVKEIGSSLFLYAQYLNSEGMSRIIVYNTSDIPTAVPWITNSVTIPEGVEIIGEGAFNSNLFRSVVLPSTLRIIGNGAFYGCKQLSSVTMTGVSEIGTNAFANCTSLTAIDLPSTIKKIGASAFSGCKQLSGVTLPNGITEIGANAFANCTSLTAIDLPSTIKKIGANAFSGCSNLTNITVPDSIEIIESGAFSGTKLPLPIQAELRRKGYAGNF